MHSMAEEIGRLVLFKLICLLCYINKYTLCIVLIDNYIPLTYRTYHIDEQWFCWFNTSDH